MRVIKNGEGSEVIFTLFQTADMPDDKFAEDAKSVKHDLNILKNLVEEHNNALSISRILTSLKSKIPLHSGQINRCKLTVMIVSFVSHYQFPHL